MPFSFTPEQYHDLLAKKVSTVKNLLAPVTTIEPEVFESATEGFRCRAEFRFWHEGERGFYAMFPKGDKRNAVEITNFPIAHPSINELMPVLQDKLNDNSLLNQRLFQVEFLCTLAGNMLVTLIYHKQLDDTWQQQAESLAKSLNINIIGRARKQKITIGTDAIEEVLNIDEQRYRYLHIEGSFTQPNGEVNQHMLSWAKSQLHTEHDLLELYCGNGNFTAVLAQQCRKLLATEISKASVKAAKWCFEANNINNVKVCRMASEEFTQAMNKEREFRRLKEQAIELDDYQFSHLFVDPPRAGLDENTLKLASQFDNILYISCNPHTLASNVEYLNQSHKVKSLAVFDQFPYTEHIECGVLLCKK